MGFIADIFTANEDRKAQTKAADRAADISQRSSDQQIALQRDMFDRLWSGTQVQRDAGDAATRMMAQLMGLSLPAGSQTPQTQPPQPNQPNQPTLPVSPATSGGGRFGGGSNALMSFGSLAPADADMTQSPMSQNALGGAPQPQVMPLQPGGPQVLPGQPGTPAPTGTPNALNPTDWLRSTPGYQFNLDEGQRAMNASLAARGGLLSGDAGREAIRYGQNYGDRIYADQFNRLAGIAGTGQTAQSQGQQAGTNYANNSSSILNNNANNQMGSSYARGNALSGFWGNVSGSINNAENMAARFMGGF